MPDVAPFELRLAASAQRQLAELPLRYATAVLEFMAGPLLAEPFRVGKPLRAELTGLLSARRGAYRIVYRVDERERLVLVLRIDHRAQAYRPR